MSRAKISLGTRLARWYDAVESRLAPQRYATRKWNERLLRFQEQMIVRDVAKSGRINGSTWLGSRLSPDSELEIEQQTAQERSREMYLNDPIAAGYVKGRVTNVIGTGLSVQAQIQEGDGITAERAVQLNRQLEELARRQFAKIDLAGRRSLWMLQRLIQRSIDRDGEAFVVFSDRPASGKPLPLSVEVVSTWRVATPPREDGNPRVRLGRRKDEDGVVTSYFIRKVDPADTVETDETYVEVPADRVCHLYEEEEAGQGRGWPASTPSLTTLKSAGEYDEAVVIGRRVAACFTAFIPKVRPMGAAIGAASSTDSAGKRLQSLEPGMIHYYDPTTEGRIEFANPGAGVDSDHAGYMESLYRRASAGYNYPAEMLTKNYGAMNFSSQRASMIEGRIEFDAGQQFQVDLCLSRLWEELVREAVIAGLVDISPEEFLLQPHLFQRHKWIPFRRDWVDPLKDVTASNKAIEGGTMSKTMIAAASGADFETVVSQRTRERLLELESDAAIALRALDIEKLLADRRKTLGLPDPNEPKNDDADKGSGTDDVENALITSILVGD